MMRPDSPNPLLLLVFTNCGKSPCSVQGFGNHVQNCHSADGLYSVVPTELILGFIMMMVVKIEQEVKDMDTQTELVCSEATVAGCLFDGCFTIRLCVYASS